MGYAKCSFAAVHQDMDAINDENMLETLAIFPSGEMVEYPQ
jgi:hypothetical protein